MWICNRCQASNKDGHAQCMTCSAPRNARRFGAGTPVEAPSIQQAAGSQRRMQVQPAPGPAEQPVMAPPPPRQRQGTLPVPPSQPDFKPAGGFVRLVGLLLAILLPLVVVVLAVLRLDSLKPVMEELFLGKAPALIPAASQVADAAADAAPATAAAGPGLLHSILGWVIYVASALVAALVAMVPGLSLWSLGHIGRNIRKR